MNEHVDDGEFEDDLQMSGEACDPHSVVETDRLPASRGRG
jgi:hypothetical protein